MQTKFISIAVQNEGFPSIEITPSTTIQEVMDREGWSRNYSIVVDSEPVPATDWSTRTLWTATEVWVTEGVKGA